MLTWQQFHIFSLLSCVLINCFVTGNTEMAIGKQSRTRFEGLSCKRCGWTSRQKIMGGRNAHVHDFPWMVTVRYWQVSICGGTIINSRYVITAAHCIHGKILALLKVAVPTMDILDMSEVSYAVADTISHDRFDPETYDYDIGLIRLTRPIRRGRTICLPEGYSREEDFAGQVATVVGWGAVKEGDMPYGRAKFHRVQIPIVTNDVCRNASGLRDAYISERMMCAGDIEGGKDACQGDSGGPLMTKGNGKGGSWEQVGIVSWGVGCGEPNNYGVYTRLSRFVDWLAANMWDFSC